MKGVNIETSKEIYKLRFPVNAQIDIEDLCNETLISLITKPIPMRPLRTVVYVGLKYGMKGQTYTLDETGDIMDEIIQEKGLSALTDAIGAAVEQALGLATMTDSAPSESKKK